MKLFKSKLDRDWATMNFAAQFLSAYIASGRGEPDELVTDCIDLAEKLIEASEENSNAEEG